MVKKSKADMIEVIIATLGEAPKTVSLDEGTTVDELRDILPEYASVKFKRNGTVLEEDEVLEDGDRLRITAKVEGGSR